MGNTLIVFIFPRNPSKYRNVIYNLIKHLLGIVYLLKIKGITFWSFWKCYSKKWGTSDIMQLTQIIVSSYFNLFFNIFYKQEGKLWFEFLEDLQSKSQKLLRTIYLPHSIKLNWETNNGKPYFIYITLHWTRKPWTTSRIRCALYRKMTSRRW